MSDEAYYALAVRVPYDLGRGARQLAYTMVYVDAIESLPDGTWFEVRTKLYPKEGRTRDFGLETWPIEDQMATWCIAWFAAPNMPREPIFKQDVDDGEENPMGGYVLLCRQEAAGGATEYNPDRARSEHLMIPEPDFRAFFIERYGQHGDD